LIILPFHPALFFPPTFRFFPSQFPKPSPTDLCTSSPSVFIVDNKPTSPICATTKAAQMERTVFHHLALPQRLPGAEEANIDEVEATIAGRLVAACRLMFATTTTFHPNLASGPGPGRLTASDAWDTIDRAISASHSVNKGGRVNKPLLLAQLESLARPTSTRPEALVLHIRRQNAAVLIHRVQR
jgi:hypothetical protein